MPNDIDITQKVGPLPLWAYGGILVGGAWLFYLYNNRQKTTPLSELGVGAGPDQLEGIPDDDKPDPDPGMPDDDDEDQDDDDDPPPPAPAPPPTPAPPQQVITVTPWPSQLSTLWGIASYVWGNGSRWPEIWNYSANAGVRSLRGVPNLIRTGDRFVIP